MRIAIIEDNPAEAAFLKTETGSFLSDKTIAFDIDVFASGEAVLREKAFYDLYLIDCLLPDGNGIELAKTIRSKNDRAAIIFTTAYLEYAAEGYETNALRYLLKPITVKKLQEALDCFIQRRNSDPTVELTGTSRFPDFVPSSKILYIEYVNRHVLVRMEDRSIETQKYLRDFEEELPDDCFFRTSRSFLVNLQHISEKQDNTLIMKNGERVKISKRKLTSFNRAYIQFLKR